MHKGERNVRRAAPGEAKAGLVEGTHRALDECVLKAQTQGAGWSPGYVYTAPRC